MIKTLLIIKLYACVEWDNNVPLKLAVLLNMLYLRYCSCRLFRPS